jgi:hypothetical protein
MSNTEDISLQSTDSGVDDGRLAPARVKRLIERLVSGLRANKFSVVLPSSGLFHFAGRGSGQMRQQSA